MVATKEKIVEIPEGVEVSIDNGRVKAKSGDNVIEKDFVSKEIEIKVDNGKITIKPLIDKRNAYSKVTTAASIIKSMLEGASGKEYEYKLEIVYSHFPITVAIKGKELEIANLRGAKKTRSATIRGNTKVEVKGKNITVKSNDKQHAGQTAANLENATKASNTDKRIFQDGIYITKKAK